jgi:hypothetical protein
MQRQPEQQQQSVLIKCPTCSRDMRLVGREVDSAEAPEVRTYQCRCGQVIVTTIGQ